MFGKLTRFFLTCLIISAANCQEDSTPIVETASSTTSAIFNDATSDGYAGESVTQPGEIPDSLGNDRLGAADNFTTPFGEGKTETPRGDTNTEITNSTAVKIANPIGLTTETIASIDKDEDTIDELTSDYVYGDEDIRFPAFTHSPPIVTTSGGTTSKQEDLNEYKYSERISKDEEITEKPYASSTSVNDQKGESESGIDSKESQDVTSSKEQIEDNIGEDATTFVSPNAETILVELMTTTSYTSRFETTPTNEEIGGRNEESTTSKITTLQQEEDLNGEETYRSFTTVNNLLLKDESSTAQHPSKQSENVTVNEENLAKIITTSSYILSFNSATTNEETTIIPQTVVTTENEQGTTLANSNDRITFSSNLVEKSPDFSLKPAEYTTNKETTISTDLEDSTDEKSLQKRYTADSSSTLATELPSLSTVADVKTETSYLSTNIPLSLDIEESIITIPPSVFEQIYERKIVSNNDNSTTIQTDNVVFSTTTEDILKKDIIQDLDVEVFKGNNSIAYENIVLSTANVADSSSTDTFLSTPIAIFIQPEENATTVFSDVIVKEIHNPTESISTTVRSIEETTNNATPLIDTANDSTTAAFENIPVTQNAFTTSDISPVFILTSTVTENDETPSYSTITTEEIINIVSTTSPPTTEESQNSTLNVDDKITLEDTKVITENNNYTETLTVDITTPASEEGHTNLFEQFTDNISTEKPLSVDANFSSDYETTLSEGSSIETTTTIIDVWLAEQNLTRTTIEEDSSTASTTTESVKDEILDVAEGNFTKSSVTDSKTESVEETTEIIDSTEGPSTTYSFTDTTATLFNEDKYTTTALYDDQQATDGQTKMVHKTFRKEKKLDVEETSTELSTRAYLEGVTTESGPNDLDLDDENLTSTIFSKELVDNGQFTADAINILKESSYETTENVYEDNLESNQGVEDQVTTTSILESDAGSVSTDVMQTTIANNVDISTERVVYTVTTSTISEELLTFNHLEEESTKKEQNALEVTLTTIHAEYFESYQHRSNETEEDESLPNKEVVLLPQETSTEMHAGVETVGNILTQKESTTTTDNIISSKKELEELENKYILNQTSTTSNFFDDPTTTSDNLNVEDNREAFIESKVNIPITAGYDERKLVIFTKYLEEKTTQSAPSEQSVDLLTQKSIMDILRGENVDAEEHSLTDRETKMNLTSLDMQNWQKLSLNELQEVEDNVEEEESEESEDEIKALEEELLNRNESHTDPVSTGYFDEDYTNSEEFNSSEIIYPDNQNNTPYLFVVPNKVRCLTGNISLKVFVGEHIMHIPNDAFVFINCLNETYDLTIAWENRDLREVDANNTISLTLKTEETHYFLESVEIKHMDNTEDTKCKKENLTMLMTKMGEAMVGEAIVDFENGFQLELMDVNLSIDENNNFTDTTYTSKAEPVISTIVLVIISTSTITCLILAIAAIIVYRKVTTKATVYKMTVE